MQEPDFTEDRIVVREEDEKAAKKGWFGRKKKQSFTSPSSKVSRPPSAASWAQPRKSTTTTDPTSPDDDLPPRVSSPAAVEVNEDASRSSVELPKHAGFDLAAMKEIIDNTAQRNPDELKVHQDPSLYPAPPIPPPTHRTESAPPLYESPSTTPVMKSSKDLPPEPLKAAGTPSQIDLNAAFQRSLSVNDLHEEPEEMTSSSYARKDNPFGPTSFSASRPSPASSLSSGGFNSNWAAEPGSHSAFGSRSFGPSTETLSFGNADGPVTPPHGGNRFAPSTNPFASASSSGLSFGSADGSITSVEAERDPWSTRPSQSKTAAFNSNPWQS